MSGGFMFPGGPLDPEQKRQYEEEIQRRKMEHEAAHQELFEFLTELPPERLSILANILRLITQHGEDGQIIAAEYYGMCRSILVVKHDRCPGCGEDHNEAFLESINAEQPEGEE